ncbi:hypothetical protein PIB30_079152 [Stylosanthes scabra]|uniref:Transcription factor CBF/NF-Y/archaeal histone domain-containing protein n=1 Tax=Stylosanthes scabra TaxID=79078 RepID=A0ABU6UR48_9FABA|nr:hypothetical protein [Stylosanthes scabra]
MDPMEPGGSSNGSSSGAAVPPPAPPQQPPHSVTKWSTIKKHLHEPPLPVEEQLQVLWEAHKKETKKKKLAIPLGSVLRQMKADDDVRRVSDEALQVFSKAGEMFAQELALRAWKHTQDDKRMDTMEKDFTAARADATIYEFLDCVETGLDTDTETETDSSTNDSEYQWC